MENIFKIFQKSPEPINTLKSEHLKAGVSPIIAGIGTPEQFKENPGDEKKVFQNIAQNSANILNVDYYENPENLSKQHIKNAGQYTYVISPIDGADKFSASFKDCTGLVVTGQDKETGENISFLSHQDPHYFLRSEDNRNSFADDLKRQLETLKKRSERETVDAVIVGGNYFKESEAYRKQYLESIVLLSKEIKGVLGFEPVVMTGPKTIYGPGTDNIFYDNKHRRLYIMRPEIGEDSTKSFIASGIKDQEKKW